MLVVGLGNPGEQYRHTRHNVGFDAAETVADQAGLRLRRALFHRVQWSGPGDPVVAVPLTYMNNSGSVIPWLLRRTDCSLDDLVVVTDNLDLPSGALRLKRGGSNRSHRGIASILDAVGSDQFLRLYIGIGRPAAGSTVVEHVLSVPEGEERENLSEAIDRAAAALLSLRTSSPDEVMNDLNRRG